MLILNLSSFPPKEILEEILEQEVFHLRDYFLRNPVVEVLFNSRIRKLNQLVEIHSSFLCSNQVDQYNPKFTLSKSKTLEELFSEVERAFTYLRGEMSQGLNSKTIATLAQQMIEVQKEYEEQFLSIYKSRQIEKAENTQIKAADQISTGRALMLLKSGSSEELNFMLAKEYQRILGLHNRL